MKKKIGILMISTILILEGILIPSILLNKAKTDANGSAGAKTGASALAEQTAANNFSSAKTASSETEGKKQPQKAEQTLRTQQKELCVQKKYIKGIRKP